MIRRLVDQAFNSGKYYISAVGLSTDVKPTEGIITGSKFVEVDTGIGYLFDETSGEWHKNQQLSAAVQAYFEDHPEAIDQAAIEAMFGDQLDGIEEDIGGLKSASDASGIFTGYNVVTDDLKTNGYIKNDGTIDTDNRFKYSRLYPITPNSRVIINSSGETGVAMVAAFYTDGTFTSASFISGLTSADVGNIFPKNITIPATAKYVAFCRRNANTFTASIIGTIVSVDVENVHTELIARNKWTIPSIDIRKGLTVQNTRRADSFTARIPVTGGQTIYCYAGVSTDANDRRTLVFNSSGTRLDYYNGFVERSITLPNNSAYLLLTADWSEREKVYVKDTSTGEYLFKYDKSVEYQYRHSYKTIKLASWNVGTWDSEYYWIDGAAVKTTHTGSELKGLLKTLFTNLSADIITLCEYVDTYDGVNIYNDVLKHFYPYKYTWNEESASVVSRVAVFSKFPLYLSSYITSIGDAVNFIGGYIMIDSETRMGYSGIHLTATSAADRIMQINAVADMYDGYDIAFFSGDMNTGNNGESSSDIQAQITPFTNAGYEPANRGYWGDMPTYYQPQIALDNIFVKGAIINSLTVSDDRPGSDHNPIVAEITLYV